ncbi:MAG: hypothetical protein K0R72_465, partial [Clostridia bacterium]|nr:hypothetical protein [Clostridia bacterium]
DSTIKQYKVGTSNATWSTYTNTFAISSYTILANNWQNADGTVTIYAKGKDSAGNEITVQKKVISLDLDRPKIPVIQSSAGYPILTSYGIILDANTTITYDSRTDIDNLYSVDNGITWKVYTGQFNFPSGTVIAKSVKKTTGLEISASKTVTMPSNAVPLSGYDGNDTTGYRIASTYILVDSSMQNEDMRMRLATHSNGGAVTINYLDINGNALLTKTYNTTMTFDLIQKIPIGTVRVYISMQTANAMIYEIGPNNSPIINSIQYLPTLTNYKVENQYSTVTIKYFPTSVQRLYSFDGITWQEYKEQAIRVEIGQTIYAKGVDNNGNQTRTINSYTAAVRSDSVPLVGYDGNDATGYRVASTYILVDPSMQNEDMRIRLATHSNGGAVSINYLDINGNILLTKYYNTTATFTLIQKVPIGTVKIYISMQTANATIYEMGPNNSTVISSTQYLPKLTITKVENEYSMVTLKYFPTSVQRLYSFDGTTWQNYQEQALRVEIGQTIYAKGIDKNGTETRSITSYTAALRADSIPPAGYDRDYNVGYKRAESYIDVNPNIQGKNMRMRLTSHSNSGVVTVRYLDVNGNILTSNIYNTYSTFYFTKTIPVGTVKIHISMQTTNATIYEIEPFN